MLVNIEHVDQLAAMICENVEKYLNNLMPKIIEEVKREEKNNELERLKVLKELEAFSEPYNTNFYDKRKHYYILYDPSIDKIKIDYFRQFKFTSLHFESYEKAKEAIDTIGEDRIKKYYFGV